MDETPADTVKHREIRFREPHEDPHQARSATLLLSDVEGVLRAQPQHPRLMLVSYDLTYVTLQVIDSLLDELGFHLDNSLFTKLRRALYYYSEEAQQAARGCRRGRGNCTQAVFVNRYRRLEHGCRDPRPEHWRRYL